MQGFGGETRRKETTWETQAYVNRSRYRPGVAQKVSGI